MIESYFEAIKNGVIEVHYCEHITAENQAAFLSKLRFYVENDKACENGVEYLIDMRLTKVYDEDARSLTEKFVNETRIIRSAIYGASLEVKNVHDKAYSKPRKAVLNHYFNEREQALAWLMAERVANAYSYTSSHVDEETGELVASEWNTLYISPDGYLEIIYTVHIDYENQNRILNQVDDYIASLPMTSNNVNVLGDMTKVVSFSDGAQMRSAETISNPKIHKVAVFGANENITAVRNEMYKAAGKESISRSFKTRDEAIAWLEIP